MILSNVRGAKAPCCSTSVPSRKSPGITTPLESVQNLQKTLQAKAKSNATAKFHSLWDKVCRPDVLVEAYRRCRLNRGVPGADGASFATIEQQGLGQWLRRLKQELSTKQYQCSPLLSVWIPKANGGQRPLSIPTIKDRVVQTAVLLVINPVFDTDLFPLILTHGLIYSASEVSPYPDSGRPPVSSAVNFPVASAGGVPSHSDRQISSFSYKK